MPNRIADVLLSADFARAPVFTTRDVAEAAGASMPAAARALAALVARRLLTPVVRGIWARPEHPSFSPYAVVPFLLGATVVADGRRPGGRGYVSLLSAMNLHGLIDQIPRAVQVVVPGQRPALATSVGTFTFHQLAPALLTGHEPGGRLANFEVATPTKAVFDTLYISTRRGRRHAHLPEVELTARVDEAEMDRYLGLIGPRFLRTAVAGRWEALRRTAASAPLAR